MRFDDGARALDRVGIHLTPGEARQLIDELTLLVGHGAEGADARLGSLDVRLYADDEQLAAGHLDGLEPVVWLGLVEVEALPESELHEHGAGAFATAASPAVSAVDYERRVVRHLTREGMQVLGFSDVEPLAERRLAGQVSDKTLELARAATESGAVECDTFYVFSGDEEADDERGSGPIPVTSERDVDQVVADVEGWARGWLSGALAHYADGFTVDTIGVAFGLRMGGDLAGVGYACSADDLAVHAELFRGVLAMAEEQA
jgi:hypothetical protein